MQKTNVRGKFGFGKAGGKVQCFLWFLVLAWIFAACEDDPDEPSTDGKTVIVYIAGDNSLNSYAYENINQMEAAFTEDMGNLFVFMDTKDDIPQILKIRHDASSGTGKANVISEVIKTYSESEYNSADPNVMKEVLSYIVDTYPSGSYGLVLWSHGTSWLPAEERIALKSFSEDGTVKMDIQDMAAAIPDATFDYIIFDACLMASVEVAWLLKDKTDYLLASPAEILAQGFPYKTTVPILFNAYGTEKMLQMAGEDFYDYYNSLSGLSQAGAISLLYLPEIEALAGATQTLLENNVPGELWNYHADEVQPLDYTALVEDLPNEKVIYDFLDFLEKNFPASAVAAVEEQLNRVVLYKAHTERFIDFDITQFCGLASYIPKNKSSYFEYLNAYYQTLPWYEASGYHILFGE